MVQITANDSKVFEKKRGILDAAFWVFRHKGLHATARHRGAKRL